MLNPLILKLGVGALDCSQIGVDACVGMGLKTCCKLHDWKWHLEPHKTLTLALWTVCVGSCGMQLGGLSNSLQ